jgi:hypothetical protein
MKKQLFLTLQWCGLYLEMKKQLFLTLQLCGLYQKIKKWLFQTLQWIRALPEDEETVVPCSPMVQTLPAVRFSPVMRTLPEDEKTTFLDARLIGLYQKTKKQLFLSLQRRGN